MPEGETGVTVFGAEGPRTHADLQARTPEALCASLVKTVDWLAYCDTLLVCAPDVGQLFRDAGWDRARVRRELLPADVDDAVARDRVLLTYAGGPAGRFTMVYRGWVSGEAGTQPVTRSVTPWL